MLNRPGACFPYEFVLQYGVARVIELLTRVPPCRHALRIPLIATPVSDDLECPGIVYECGSHAQCVRYRPVMGEPKAIYGMICLVEGTVVAVFARNIGDIGIEVKKYAVVIRLDLHFTVIVVDQKCFIVGQSPEQARGRLEDFALKPAESVCMLKIGDCATRKTLPEGPVKSTKPLRVPKLPSMVPAVRSNWFRGFLVIMLMLPPGPATPNSADPGPFNTSMRSTSYIVRK